MTLFEQNKFFEYNQMYAFTHPCPNFNCLSTKPSIIEDKGWMSDAFKKGL